MSIVGFIPPSIAQLKYNPYGMDATISLTEPEPYGFQNGPNTPYQGQTSYAPQEGTPYQPNGGWGVNAAVNSSEGCCADEYYREYNNTKGYQGVASASRAGEVASISVCEMIAAAALVGAIAVIALVFNTGHAH